MEVQHLSRLLVGVEIQDMIQRNLPIARVQRLQRHHLRRRTNIPALPQKLMVQRNLPVARVQQLRQRPIRRRASTRNPLQLSLQVRAAPQVATVVRIAVLLAQVLVQVAAVHRVAVAVLQVHLPEEDKTRKA